MRVTQPAEANWKRRQTVKRNNLTEIIDSHRRQAGLTMEALAEGLYVARGTAYNYRQNPEVMSVGTLRRMAELLSLTDAEILKIVKGVK